MNFVQKRGNNVEQLFPDMWKADFQKKTSILDTPNSSEDQKAFRKMKSSIDICTDDGR